MASRGFLHELNLLRLAFFDKRTPGFAKALIIFGAVYGISPLDFIPDLLPLLGQLDDVGIIAAVIVAFVRMSRTVRNDLRKRSAVETTARRAS